MWLEKTKTRNLNTISSRKKILHPTNAGYSKMILRRVVKVADGWRRHWIGSRVGLKQSIVIWCISNEVEIA